MSDNKWEKREVGTLYKKKSKSGNTFLAGTIKNGNGQKIKVIVFSNAAKKKEKIDNGEDREYVDKIPDYVIYESEDQGTGGGGNTTQGSRPAPRPAPKSAPQKTYNRKPVQEYTDAPVEEEDPLL